MIDLDAFEEFTEHTITDRPGLPRDLAATAERGYALDNRSTMRS